MDDDGSGDITPQEFHIALKKLGVKLTESELNIVVAEIDEDGDGSISVGEFENAVQRHRDFKGFNSDGDIASSDEEDDEEAKAAKAREKANLELKPIMESVLTRWSEQQLTSTVAAMSAPENVAGLIKMYAPMTEEEEAAEADADAEAEAEKSKSKKKKKRRKTTRKVAQPAPADDENETGGSVDAKLDKRGSAPNGGGDRLASVSSSTSWQRTVAVTASLTPTAFEVGLRDKTRDPLQNVGTDGDVPEAWGEFTVDDEAMRMGSMWNKEETAFATKLAAESDPIQAMQIITAHWEERLALSPMTVDVDGIMAGEWVANSAMLVQLFARSPNSEIDKAPLKELLDRLAHLLDQVQKLKRLSEQDFERMGAIQRRRSIDCIDTGTDEEEEFGEDEKEVILRNKRMPRLTMLISRVPIEMEEGEDEAEESKGEGEEEEEKGEDEEKYIDEGEEKGEDEDKDEGEKIKMARVASRRAAGKATKGRKRATFAVMGVGKKAAKAENPFLKAASVAAAASAVAKEKHLKMRWIKSHTHQVSVHLAKVSFEMKKLQNEIVSTVIRVIHDQARFVEIQGRVCAEAVGNVVEQWVGCRKFDPSTALREERTQAEIAAVSNSLVRGRMHDILHEDSSDEMLFLREVTKEHSDSLRRM
jgi:hypothetical protein